MGCRLQRSEDVCAKRQEGNRLPCRPVVVNRQSTGLSCCDSWVGQESIVLNCPLSSTSGCDSDAVERLELPVNDPGVVVAGILRSVESSVAFSGKPNSQHENLKSGRKLTPLPSSWWVRNNREFLMCILALVCRFGAYSATPEIARHHVAREAVSRCRGYRRC